MALRNFKVTLAGEDLGVFDHDALTLNDGFVMLNNTGMTFNDMLGLLNDRTNPVGLRALVWYLRFKQGKTIDLNAIDFKLTEFDIEAITAPKVQASTRKQKSTSESSGTTSA